MCSTRALLNEDQTDTNRYDHCPFCDRLPAEALHSSLSFSKAFCSNQLLSTILSPCLVRRARRLPSSRRRSRIWESRRKNVCDPVSSGKISLRGFLTCALLTFIIRQCRGGSYRMALVQTLPRADRFVAARCGEVSSRRLQCPAVRHPLSDQLSLPSPVSP